MNDMPLMPDTQLAVRFRRLPHAQGLPPPTYAEAGAAGLDLAAAIDGKEPLVIWPHRLPVLVPTGFQIEIPHGYEGQVRPRSGLTSRTGLTVANAPGTIDASFRGEVKIALINNGPQPVEIKRGDRVAQLVIAPVARMRVIETDELSETARGAGGWGSTGS